MAITEFASYSCTIRGDQANPTRMSQTSLSSMNQVTQFLGKGWLGPVTPLE